MFNKYVVGPFCAPEVGAQRPSESVLTRVRCYHIWEAPSIVCENMVSQHAPYMSHFMP